MAPLPSSSGIIQIHDDPEPCNHLKSWLDIGPRQLIVSTNHNRADHAPTTSSPTLPPAKATPSGLMAGIIIAIVVALCIILLIVQHVRRVQFRREVARSARLTRLLNDQGAGRAQVQVRSQWDAIDKRNTDRTELARAASETLTPPAEVYRNSRDDWGQIWI